MRFSMLYSGEQILSFKSCLVFYAGDSLKLKICSEPSKWLISRLLVFLRSISRPDTEDVSCFLNHGRTGCQINLTKHIIWAASSEFGTYRLCEQRRFRRACASAQSSQNLRCSLIQAVSQQEPSDRKPDPWPL